jgi:putative oxidoreductase
MRIPFLIGRIMFGGFFLYSGINHFLKRKTMAQYARSKNVPLAEAAVVATGTMLFIGGASVISGVKPKIGIAAAVTFLAGVSPVMHNFWNQQDATIRQNEMVHFAKNMALLGAAVSLMSIDEPWPQSLGKVRAIRRATSKISKKMSKLLAA